MAAEASGARFQLPTEAARGTLVAVQAGLGLLAGPIPQHFSKASFPRESNLGKVCLPRLYQDSSGGFQLNWNPKP